MSDRVPEHDEPLPWPRWHSWLAIFAVCITAGLLRFTYFHLGDLTGGGTVPWQARMVNEMEGCITLFLLVPFPLWVARRARFRPGQRAPALLLHALAATAVSLIATTIHLLVRSALYPRFGLGPYPIGPLFLRYAMEYPNDMTTYTVVVVAVLWIDTRQRGRKRALATAQMETQLARLQLQNLRSCNCSRTSCSTRCT